jgi:parvulin-like peptidyl-prolyl isomerase
MKFIKISFWIVLLVTVFTCCSSGEIIERIVARIDGEVITLMELEEDYQRLKSSVPSDERLPTKRELLERMVENRLLLHQADQRGIKVSPGEVEDYIERVKTGFVSSEAFELALKQEGVMLEDLRKRYRDELKIKKLIDIEIRSRIDLSKKEVKEYYEENKEKFRLPERVEIRHILFNDYARALAALDRLHSHVKFEEVARQEGMPKDGYLGSFKKGQLSRKIEDAAFGLEEGKISPIINTETGYHILKLEKKIEGRIQKLSEVRETIEYILSSHRMEKKVNEYIEELKKSREIEIKL